MNKYIKINVMQLLVLSMFIGCIANFAGSVVGKTISSEQDTTNTVLSAGHLQCKLDNIKSTNKWKAELIESVKREADTLVKMHIAKTALANMTSTD